MTSTDYKVRFKAEYEQLAIRIEELSNYLIEIKRENVHQRCQFEVNVLKIQLKRMLMYQNILEIRANIEKINLI